MALFRNLGPSGARYQWEIHISTATFESLSYFHNDLETDMLDREGDSSLISTLKSFDPEHIRLETDNENEPSDQVPLLDASSSKGPGSKQDQHSSKVLDCVTYQCAIEIGTSCAWSFEKQALEMSHIIKWDQSFVVQSTLQCISSGIQWGYGPLPVRIKVRNTKGLEWISRTIDLSQYLKEGMRHIQINLSSHSLPWKSKHRRHDSFSWPPREHRSILGVHVKEGETDPKVKIDDGGASYTNSSDSVSVSASIRCEWIEDLMLKAIDDVEGATVELLTDRVVTTILDPSRTVSSQSQNWLNPSKHDAIIVDRGCQHDSRSKAAYDPLQRLLQFKGSLHDSGETSDDLNNFYYAISQRSLYEYDQNDSQNQRISHPRRFRSLAACISMIPNIFKVCRKAQ